eukprot:190577-Amphidinium_carterae.1
MRIDEAHRHNRARVNVNAIGKEGPRSLGARMEGTSHYTDDFRKFTREELQKVATAPTDKFDAVMLYSFRLRETLPA